MLGRIEDNHRAWQLIEQSYAEPIENRMAKIASFRQSVRSGKNSAYVLVRCCSFAFCFLLFCAQHAARTAVKTHDACSDLQHVARVLSQVDHAAGAGTVETGGLIGMMEAEVNMFGKTAFPPRRSCFFCPCMS